MSLPAFFTFVSAYEMKKKASHKSKITYTYLFFHHIISLSQDQTTACRCETISNVRVF